MISRERQTLRKVAKAILESDPTCNYDACERRVAADKTGSEENWWDGLHAKAAAAIRVVRMETLEDAAKIVEDAGREAGQRSADVKELANAIRETADRPRNAPE